MEEGKKEGLQELKQHGTRLFPFNIYPCSIPVDFPSVPLHWQKSMEIIFIKKGNGFVRMGMECMEAEEGDIFIVPPENLHALTGKKGVEMQYENIIFDIDFLGSGAADICAQEYLVPLQAGRLLQPMKMKKGEEGYEKASDCLHGAEELCRWRETGYELGVKASMLQLLWVLVRICPQPPRADTADVTRLKFVLQCVEERYRQELSVPMIAKACGCSESHFMRWFKKMTGTSFTAYLNERRLAASAEALRQSDEKVLSIAQNAGFANLSNFNRQFLARYGVTPSEYRAGSL